MAPQSLHRSSRTTTESTSGAGSEVPELSLDQVFDLLSNERRRRTLWYLLTESETTTLGDLAEHIASIENDKPTEALSSTERKRIYICLYQCHLPKMDDAGVIDFDEDRKTIEIGETIDQVTRFLPEQDETRSARTTRGLTTTVTDLARSVGGRFRNAKASWSI